MSTFEYRAVPAPTRGTKAKTAKSTEDRFALSITEALNEMAAEGWEYVRAETLPCDERKGLTGTQTTYQNILIFKRFKQVAQPLPLDARTTSRPLPVEPEFVGPAQEIGERVRNVLSLIFHCVSGNEAVIERGKGIALFQIMLIFHSGSARFVAALPAPAMDVDNERSGSRLRFPEVEFLEIVTSEAEFDPRVG